MPGRVIQGFFPAGQPRPLPGPPTARPVQAKRELAGAPSSPGPPRPAFTGGSVAQRFGGNGNFAVDPVQLGLARGGGTPLPVPLLAKMEAAFGADFSAVRVHVGAQAARIGAIAFTTGNDLYFAPGRYQPSSVQGQQLIGHELAHVIQQRQGRVQASGGGVSVVQDRALEAEADRLGQRAAMYRAPIQRAAAGRARTIQRSAAAPQQPATIFDVHGLVWKTDAEWAEEFARLPAAVTVHQNSGAAWADRAAFSWLTTFSARGPGNLTGMIIQDITRTFGTGRDSMGLTGVVAKQQFFECFPTDALGRAGSDQFASDLAGAATDDDGWCYSLLEGKLYYLSAASADFAAIRAGFKENNAAVPPEITMLACTDLDRSKIGPQLAYRDLYFEYNRRSRKHKIVIMNTTEGAVVAQEL